MRGEHVTIGRFEVPIETGMQWIRDYTDGAANLTSDSPYAYPAYDCYLAGNDLPTVLSDADFMAPGLLNVPVRIRSFYGLQRVRERLESNMRPKDLARPLAELADDRIAELTGRIYAVLDNPSTKPWGVNGTTLSKVLHRKRPASIALHDKWVQACYVGNDAPVPTARTRTWADYMALVSQAMAADLRSQTDQFLRLQRSSGAKPALTDLRLLDILAWNVGQGAPSRDFEPTP
jgi:Family of unknown function (DUF6308)